ncbi:MAG: hypothetical protein CMM52_13415 [Rhodospirillaceae bacterium]|nr:hypothetical protein [Rhodospirillaceae bacterium]
MRPSYDPTAEIAWIVRPVTRKIGPQTYNGIGWRLRITGLDEAAWVTLGENGKAATGDWYVQQSWGKFIEHQLGFDDRRLLEEGWHGAHHQPFTYFGGSKGSVVSYFAKPVAARLAVEARGPNLPHLWHIPLGKGSIRSTPEKLWLANKRPLKTKWKALDEWVYAYDSVAGGYRRLLGLQETQPKPTLWWQHPSEDYYLQFQSQGVTKDENLWTKRFADTVLRDAVSMGFGVVYLEGLWETDGQYPESRYLHNSQSFGSIDAPWRLRISRAVGGNKGLADLVKRAHKSNVKILLWSTPGHLSNSSPLLIENPDWIRWKYEGVPETAGYGDVTGVDLRSGYLDYAISQYRKIRKSTKFDGMWIDSFLTFGILPNGREKQYAPQLDRKLFLQRQLQKMGAGELHIEGAGPFGISTGGYGYEGYVLGNALDKAVARRKFQHIRGREYGLYRYIADTIVEPNSYFRALASKGAIGVFKLSLLKRLSKQGLALIARSNSIYREVLPELQIRELMGKGEEWFGVSWSNRQNKNKIIFAFKRFQVETGAAIVENLMNGDVKVVKKGFITLPKTIFRIRYDLENAQ